MSYRRNQNPDTGQPMVYRIRIKGYLDIMWKDWFDGMNISQEDNGDSILEGSVMDQAALHGLLKKVRDLGIPLVSVSPVEPGNSTTHAKE